MMKKLVKNNHFIVSVIVLLITLISFIKAIISNQSIYLLNGDSVEQYYQFLLGFWQKVHDGSFSMFDFTNGFGANAYSMIYYNMLSPFTWLVLLLKKEWIMHVVLYLQILKMILLANFSVMWLSKVSKNNNHILIGSLVLTFSGWVFFYWHYDFLNSFIFYPLILYFIESYLQENKTLGLIITTFLLTINNYYFMYMFVPFGCLYALFRYITLNDDNTFRKVLTAGIKFVLIFVLSIFSASFILVPCIKIILESGRVSDEQLTLFIPWRDLFKILSSMLSPIFSRIEPNYFITSDKTTYQGWGGGAPIYTSLSLLVFVPTVFFIDDKKKRNCLLIFGGIVFIFMFSPYFYKLFQGTIDTRFFYMFTIWMVLMIVETLDNYKEEYFKYLVCNFVLLIIIVGLCFWLSYYKGLSESTYFDLQVKLEIVLLIITVVALILVKFKKTKLLLIPIILECLVSNINFKINNEPIDYITINNDYYYDSSVYDEIKEYDDGFYRIIGAKNQNESFANNINGVNFYTSLYNFEQRDFLDIISPNWSVYYSQNYNSLYTLTGAKYFYQSDEDEVAPYGYSKVADKNFYINNYYLDLGWVNNQTINIDSIKDLPDYEKVRILKEYVATENSVNTKYTLKNNIDEVYYALLEATADRDGYIELEFEKPISDTTFYIVKSTYPKINIDYFYNDEIIKSEFIYTYDTYSFNIKEDEEYDKIVIRLRDEKDYTLEEVTIYRESDVSKIEEEIYKQRKENSFTNVEYKPDYIKGDISVKQDNSLVYTYVPYDDGFKVKANGEEIEYFKVNGGFIGFYLDSGDYTIEFTYSIPLLKQGICISVISIVLLIVIVKGNKKR